MTSNVSGGADRAVDGSRQSVGASSDWGASGPPPRVDAWPTSEVLEHHDVVLARPRVQDAAGMLALQSDPALHIDVPLEWRVSSVTFQADDLRRFVAHWHDHGFGYWLVWAGDDGDIPMVTHVDSDRAMPVADDARSGNGPDGAGAIPVGVAGLRWLWWRDRWVLNVFVRFARAVQGHGLATAVLTRAITRLDADLDVATPVVVRTRDANRPMVALAHRLGMVDTGYEEREMGTYRLLERMVGGNAGSQHAPPDVRARSRGPWIVQPHVAVVDHRDGAPGTVVPVHRQHQNVALCRCGRTATPPICDRSHAGIDMQQVTCTVGAVMAAADIELDEALVAAAALCPPDTVLVLPAGHDRESGAPDDAMLVCGAGLTVQLVDERSVRPSVPVWACRCGTHVEAVRLT